MWNDKRKEKIYRRECPECNYPVSDAMEPDYKRHELEDAIYFRLECPNPNCDNWYFYAATSYEDGDLPSEDEFPE